MSPVFQKVLIANRGEIACRIIRYCQSAHIEAVAVYTPPDRQALHVQQADEAYALHDIHSYGNIEEMIAIALRAQAQAIHPGYGFLSEQAAFAQACLEAGLVFIGPPPPIMALLANKREAKIWMEQQGIPTVPGYHGADQSYEQLMKQAKQIGWPLLIKAALGGGGKGMRIIHGPDELEVALVAAKREALQHFKTDALILERWLPNPRHIEVQIAGDRFNHVIHLFDRDCSIQRRHQKVLEEAPAPFLSTELRNKLLDTAVAIGKQLHYQNVGTIEFLVDGQACYFLEMNTRLQVEHPITEAVTGIDLVDLQFKLAQGEPLPYTQKDIPCTGHSIEARIYAEQPAQNFLPATGYIEQLKEPQSQSGLRLDTGIKTNDTISCHYDPLLAKLIAWGNSRTQAIQRLQQGLTAYRMLGVKTNLTLLSAILKSPLFQQPTHTLFLNTFPIPTEPNLQAIDIAMVALYQMQQPQLKYAENALSSPWQTLNCWQMLQPGRYSIELQTSNKSWIIELQPQYKQHYQVTVNDESLDLTLLTCTKQSITVEYKQMCLHRVIVAIEPTKFYLLDHHDYHEITLLTKNKVSTHVTTQTCLQAPIPGTIVDILVEVGTTVTAHQPLLVIEAMKMEHTIRAPHLGTVNAILYKKGDTVNAQNELMILAPPGD